MLDITKAFRRTQRKEVNSKETSRKDGKNDRKKNLAHLSKNQARGMHVTLRKHDYLRFSKWGRTLYSGVF